MSYRMPEAERYALEAITVAREIDDVVAITRSTNSLGWGRLNQRRFSEAIAEFTHALEAAQRLPASQRQWVGIAVGSLAVAYAELEESRNALDYSEQSLAALSASEAEPRLLYDALFWNARIKRDLGDLDGSEQSLARAEDCARLIGGQIYDGMLALERGRLLLARDEYAESLSSFHLSSEIALALRDQSLQGQALEGVGRAYRQLGRAQDAVNFLQQAGELLRQSRETWLQARLSHELAAALDESGDGAGATAARGQGLALIESYDDPPALALAGLLRSS